MKIYVAPSAGFCFGVKRALTLAFNTADKNKNVEMLGDIVHNDLIVKKVKTAGIKKIKRLGNGAKKTLLISAHGVSAATLQKAHLKGYRVVDATCPMVKEIHAIVKKAEQQGFTIIVIGDKHHDEVRGIVGQISGKALVIDDTQYLPLKKIQKVKKAAVVVQSTQNVDTVLAIVKQLRRLIKNLKFFNTICRTTRIKQMDIKKMPRAYEVMIIIGSRSSANTRRLFEISRSLNPRSHWIDSQKEIQTGWFRNAKTVGITAGASTPDSAIQAVVKRIQAISSRKIH